MPLDFQTMRRNMIQSQILPSSRVWPCLMAGLDALPREVGVGELSHSFAYADADLDVGEGRFMLSPAAFTKLAAAAEIQPHESVLDVGCTTGYTTALLSYVARQVVGVEVSPVLCEKARKYLSQQNIHNASIEQRAFLKEKGTDLFDVILIEGALQEVPSCLQEQLKDGGRLLSYRKEGEGMPATAILSQKREGHLFTEPLFSWQASSLDEPYLGVSHAA